MPTSVCRGPRLRRGRGSLVDVDPASVMTLDLTTTSDVYDVAFSDDGSLKAGVEDELARAAVQNGARLVVTQYGQARLSRTRKLSQASPDVVATGISLWAASATPMIAPWDGEVKRTTSSHCGEPSTS